MAGAYLVHKRIYGNIFHSILFLQSKFGIILVESAKADQGTLFQFIKFVKPIRNLFSL